MDYEIFCATHLDLVPTEIESETSADDPVFQSSVMLPGEMCSSTKSDWILCSWEEESRGTQL